MRRNKRTRIGLSPLIDTHLKLRESLGFHDQGTRGALYQFENFLKEKFRFFTIVTRPMVIDYLHSIQNLHPRTRCNRVLAIRQFCRFLYQSDTEVYIPEKNLVPKGKTSVRPYIFTEKEVTILIQQALHLNPTGTLRPYTCSTLIGLLWVCGLRVGEASSLNLQDIDLEQGILHIRMTKFAKSRLVPISPSTIAALSKYLELRASYGHSTNKTDPVFVNERCNRYSVQNAEANWRELVSDLEMKTQQGKRPRMHDLRHSFATQWLADFYGFGKDPAVSLPILATYLGHANITATELYLHPSLKLLETAGQRFRQYAESEATLGQRGCHE